MLQLVANLLLNLGRRSNPLFITETSVKRLTWPNTSYSDRENCFAMLQHTFCSSTNHATHWSIYVKENRRRMVSIYALHLVGHVFTSWLTDRLSWWYLWAVFATSYRVSPGEYYVITPHDMKACGGKEAQLHQLLTFLLAKGDWTATRPGRFTVGGRAPCIHMIWSWVETRACLNTSERDVSLVCPVRNLTTIPSRCLSPCTLVPELFCIHCFRVA